MHADERAPPTRRGLRFSGRWLLVALLSLDVLPPEARASKHTSIEATEAVDRALDQAGLERLERGEVELARANVRAAGIWPNPTLAWQREGIPGGVAEDFLSVTQPIEISGQRRLETAAARRRVEATRHDNARRRRRIGVRTRLRFYALLRDQRRVAALERGIERLTALVERARDREDAGDTSRYDRLRIERTNDALRARLVEARSDRDAARAELAALLPAGEGRDNASDAPLRASGELLPSEPPPLKHLRERVDARGDLAAMRAREEANELRAEAARRGRIPKLELGIGWKTAQDGGAREHGYMGMASFSLPVFDRQQAEQQRAKAARRRTAGRRRLERTQIRRSLASLRARAKRLRGAARRHRNEAIPRADALLEAARAAWKSGDASTLELAEAGLDTVEVRLRALELAHAARKTRLQLRLRAGGSTRSASR